MVKLKSKNKMLKRILAFILTALMLVTTIPMTAYAADINLGDVDNNTNIPISVSTHYGHELHTTTVNGQTYPLFCIEYGKSSPNSSTLESQGEPSDSKVLEAARWIFAGYYMEQGNAIDWLNMAYAQKKAWSVLGWETTWSFSTSGYNEWVANAEENMRNLNIRPSFDGKSDFKYLAGTTHTITDTNGVLKDYPAFTQDSNGVKIVHEANSNELTISIDSNCTQTSFAILDRKYWKTITGDANNCLLYAPASGGTQRLLYSAYYDPVSFTMSGTITPLGHIELTKQDIYGANVDGAEFGLYTDSNCSTRIATATSSNGLVKFNNLAPNTYYVKEISAPEGYLISDEVVTVTVTSGATSKNTVENTEPTGEIHLTKELGTDKTNGLYGDVLIEEAEYTLYAAEDITSKAGSKTFYTKDEVISSKTITASSDGKTGTIEWDNLPLGSYYIKETKNPIGTFLDETVHNVTLSYINSTTSVVIDDDTFSTDTVKSMKVKIFKSGSDGTAGVMPGLEGAEFTIKLYSDYQDAVSQGYTEQEIWAHKSDDGSWVYNDNEGKSTIVDSARAEKANEIAPNYDVITTDANGNAVSNYLPYGRYIGKETYTPVDYTSGSDFIFSITNDESEVSVEEQVKLIVINNAPVEYPVKIVKKDADSEKTVTLSSANFKIRATQNIYNTTTGEIIYANGEYVSYKVGSTTYNEFMTNSDGYVVPSVNSIYANANDDKGSVTTPFKLPAGNYEVVEIISPEGFLIQENPIPFKVTSILDYDEDADGDTVIPVVVENEQPKAEIVINKSFALRDNMDKTLIENIDYTKVGFELKAADDIIDMADGSVVFKAGDTIGSTYYLDNTGSLTISNLWIGNYTLQEVSTIDGAVLDDTVYEASFTVKDNTTKVYTSTFNIENYTTEVDLSKTDITGEPELEGAELSVIDANGNVIDSWTSTTTPHKIEGLVVGQTYTLHEEIAPTGYVVASDITFTVENTSDIQTVKMVDKQVTVSKTDVTTGEELPGAELHIEDAEGNIIDSWTSTTEPHIVVGLVEGETYTLVETTAPYGYHITENVQFTVTTDKETQKVVMEDAPILSDIRVNKVDSVTKQNIVSNKFAFTLYADAECTIEIITVNANTEDGTATFEDLRFGTYYIKETMAPEGYELSDEVVEVVINDEGVFANGTKIEELDGVYSIEYQNTLLPIIYTGDDTNNIKDIIFFVIAVVVIIVLAIILIKKSKNKKK